MKSQQKAYLYAGIAVLCWSTVASAFKVGLRDLNFIQFLFFSTWTAFFVLLFINRLLSCRTKTEGKHGRPPLLFPALMGALSPFAYYLVLFRAYELLPAQVAQPLNMIWPIVLVFMSVLILGQKVRAVSFLSLFICFAGVYLISSRGEPWSFRFRDPLGVSLAAGSSVIWSAYFILNVRKGGDETLQLLYNFFFASVYISLLMLGTSGFQGLNMRGILLAVYAGVFEMGLSFLLWIRAMKLSEGNDRISNLVYIAPFISLIFIRIFVGEHIYVTSLAGLSLIVLGILLEKIRLF